MSLVQRRKAIIREIYPHLQLTEEPKFGGKTLLEWDAKWLQIDGGFTILHSQLRHNVGLFQARLSGVIMYIGKAVEKDNGGLRKRLSDFRRPSPSGREHYGAMRIYDNLEELELYVLPTGSDQKAVELVELLKPAMIVHHSPPWNMEKEQARLANKANIRLQPEAGRGASVKPRPNLKLVSN